MSVATLAAATGLGVLGALGTVWTAGDGVLVASLRWLGALPCGVAFSSPRMRRSLKSNFAASESTRIVRLCISTLARDTSVTSRSTIW